jgi:aminoglycoside phosphotransferase (APT) family kinase protein
VTLADPPQIDGEPDLTRLADHLAAVLPGGLAGPLSCRLIAGGRSNPTYELSDGRSDWILRRPPYGTVWDSAHDMGREARVMSALAATAVPVPMVVATCEDASVLGAPFYLMDRLEGRTLRSHEDTARLTRAERAGLADSLLDTLVALHEVEPASVGLADFGRADGYLERQLRRWGRQWDVVRTRELPVATEVHEHLTRTMPAQRLNGVVHGDYKIDNVMVAHDDPTTIVGVLDWEMATLGDTLADVGFLVAFWDEAGKPYNPITAGTTAHDGFPSADEVVAGYAARRGIEMADVDWYVAFSDFKLAVILQQIHHRHLRGETVGDWFDDIGDMVEPLLLRAHARARTF